LLRGKGIKKAGEIQTVGTFQIVAPCNAKLQCSCYFFLNLHIKIIVWHNLCSIICK